MTACGANSKIRAALPWLSPVYQRSSSCGGGEVPSGATSSCRTSWRQRCRTCIGMSAVRAGFIGRGEAKEHLVALSRAVRSRGHVWSPQARVDATGEPLGPDGRLRPEYGRRMYSSTIDRTGPQSCRPAERDVISDAITLIENNINAIPNFTSFSWLGNQYPKTPRDLVAYTLGSNGKVLRIHCDGGCANPAGVGWSVPQYAETFLDVYICDAFWDAGGVTGPTGTRTRQLACLIVHELMHAWGAGEDLAELSEPTGQSIVDASGNPISGGWTCISGGQTTADDVNDDGDPNTGLQNLGLGIQSTDAVKPRIGRRADPGFGLPKGRFRRDLLR